GPKGVRATDQAAVALSGRGLVERLVHRLGEARVPPEEREAVVTAVAALASLSMGPVLDAFIAAPVDLRAPYRGAVRKAADRALEPLPGKLVAPDARGGGARDALDVLARYAEPGGMMHRRSATVRAAAVDGLRHIARPEARGLLELYSKDKEPAVRKAAEAGLKDRKSVV